MKFVIVADVAFACYKIGHICVKTNGALISRLRLDARVFNFPPQEKKRKGRPLLVGKTISPYLPTISKIRLLFGRKSKSNGMVGGEKNY